MSRESGGNFSLYGTLIGFSITVIALLSNPSIVIPFKDYVIFSLFLSTTFFLFLTFSALTSEYYVVDLKSYDHSIHMNLKRIFQEKYKKYFRLDDLIENLKLHEIIEKKQNENDDNKKKILEVLIQIKKQYDNGEKFGKLSSLFWDLGYSTFLIAILFLVFGSFQEPYNFLSYFIAVVNIIFIIYHYHIIDKNNNNNKKKFLTSSGFITITEHFITIGVFLFFSIFFSLCSLCLLRIIIFLAGCSVVYFILMFVRYHTYFKDC